jgi:hypothetical protein
MLRHHGVVARTGSKTPFLASSSSRASIERSSSAATLGPGFGLPPRSRPSVSRLLAREERVDKHGLRPRFEPIRAKAPPLGSYELGATARTKGVVIRSTSQSSFDFSRPTSSISASTESLRSPLWDLRSRCVSNHLDPRNPRHLRFGDDADEAPPPTVPRFASAIPFDRETAEMKALRGLPSSVSLMASDMPRRIGGQRGTR